MKVYITYDRYENDEWFQVYKMSTSKPKILENLKSNLISFLEYGPDDCHSFQCQEVDLTKDEYRMLVTGLEETDTFEYLGDDSNPVYDLLVRIYDEIEPDYSDCILVTDGCSDWVDLIQYIIDHDPDYTGCDPDDVEQDLFDRFDDDETYKEEWLNKYLKDTYGI